jgi:hypothetical protein
LLLCRCLTTISKPPFCFTCCSCRLFGAMPT